MRLCLNAGIDWKARAKDARQSAEQEADPVMKARLDAPVKEYERLAARPPEPSNIDDQSIPD
jgi:hypothetical protein